MRKQLLSFPNQLLLYKSIVWGSSGGWQGVWRDGRKGAGKGGPVTEWMDAEMCSGVKGGVIQASVG